MCCYCFLEILQIFHGALDESVLSHIQMGIDFHGSSDAGVTDGFGESGQIEVWIVLMLDVIVGHIGMPESMHGDIVRQTDFFTDLPVTLAGAAADTTAEGEV